MREIISEILAIIGLALLGLVILTFVFYFFPMAIVFITAGCMLWGIIWLIDKLDKY